MYYSHTTEALLTEIKNRFPDATPQEALNEESIENYLMWMTIEIQRIPKDIDGALKAARWLGWILRAAETDLKLWDNARSRELVRKDREAGNDRPKI